jgi:minor extracellular serine protease Vpr
MRRVGWTAALAAAVAILVAGVGGAVAKGQGGSQNAVRFAKVDPALYASDGVAGKFTPASLSNKRVAAVVQLGGAPVAVRDANAKRQGVKLTTAQKAAIRQQLRAQQDALHGQLANAGAKIVGQMQDAYNGVHVVVPQKNLAQLASLPNVVGIHAVPSFKPANIHGVPFIGAPTAWQNTGATGAGVKVGIIDTGVDYTHADFGGAGTVAAFDYAFAHSTVDPATDPQLAAQFGPTAPRVKGGFDFVGDDYDANVPGSVPQPDKNPLDCFNHGTHTAGTLAGSGVTNTGATYTGPYDGSISTNPADWNVFPGVAPQADIYEYRVFGCGGSSNIVDLAINQAVADGMSVISMSLGSDFGGDEDPTSVAAQNAVNDGISVVASAGNAGGSGYTVGSPSTVNGVLSVAAMDGTTPTFPGGHFALSTGASLDAINANGATFSDGLTLPVVVVHDSSQPGGVSLGCSTADFEAANVAGKLAVVQRGTCARVAKAIFGSDAGAAAVAMINNAAGYPPFEGDITSNPDTGEPHAKITIPFFGIKDTVTGADAATLLAADGGSVVLTNNTVDNPGYKTTTSFSSGGPRNPDSAPKPDVIAPGLSVLSAGIGTGTGPLVDSGTSMACPMTAGIAALVKQLHPSWNGLQIKAAIMNTADSSLNTGYNVRRAGAGVVQAQKATNSSVLATTSDQLDSIAFGYVPGSGAHSAQKSFTLTNLGSSAAIYHLDVATNGSQQGAVVGVSPSTVTIAPGSTETVQVSLSIPESAFAALPSDDTFSIGPGGVLTVRGDIVATPDASDTPDDQTLVVPYLVVPRGLSNVTAGVPAAWTKSNSPSGKGFASTLPLTNSGIHDGTADLYAWGIHDANDSNAPMDVRDVGVQVQPGANFGVSDSDRGLVFLINTYGQATNQSVNEYDVLIDTNGDGQPDFAVVGADLGAVLTGDNNGQFASFTINVSTGDLIDAFFADAPMNGSTIELPAVASEIGLVQKAAKPMAFRYTVNAFSNVPGGIVDTMGSALFDPFHPAVSSGVLNPDGTPTAVPAGGSASLPLSIDKSQQAKRPALGWLVASVDDANGAPQADEVAAPALK